MTLTCNDCLYHTEHGCSWNDADPWPAPCEEEDEPEEDPDDWEDW